MRKVYLDYSATTPLDPRVLKAMQPYFTEKFGNTMSLHTLGLEAADALEKSRETVASFMKAQNEEVIFNCSATESINFVLKGIAFANREKGKHIITSSIEHHAVLETCRWLKTQGFEITYLPVDKYGFVNLVQLDNAIRDDTILVSIMHANNEIGTIEPIEEIGRICSDHEIYFHTDAVQSFGKLSIDVNKMNIDLLSLSAHKFYGPKGVGATFIRKGTKIEPLLHGGGHEFNLRSSTVNVPGIVGLAKAVELRKMEMKTEAKRLTELRDYLIKNVLKIENSHLNGDPKIRLPNNANFWFSFIEGEALVVELSSHGVYGSTGSACSSSTLEPSHVLTAIGLKHEEAHGSLRLSLGKDNSKADIDYTLKVLPNVIKRLRKISPFKGK
ncbi:cysteine desulfurase NifS [Candidatus Micrarchaeota archaeon RBG_16_36_9]|nr:MAG: cysteine desulfurase NifS [Candidatus Micrarchaeota archaeon RBG_16_36_9]